MCALIYIYKYIKIHIYTYIIPITHIIIFVSGVNLPVSAGDARK